MVNEISHAKFHLVLRVLHPRLPPPPRVDLLMHQEPLASVLPRLCAHLALVGDTPLCHLSASVCCPQEAPEFQYISSCLLLTAQIFASGLQFGS